MVVYRTKNINKVRFCLQQYQKCSYKSTFSHLVFNLKMILIFRLKKKSIPQNGMDLYSSVYCLQNNFCSIGIFIF